jgi:protein-S-isoprenylcysteine O-methyltransferase Ste14
VRIQDEERFLVSEFGDEYERYRHRTWRLLPLVY